MNRLGCIKDKPDKRDYLMRAYLPLSYAYIERFMMDAWSSVDIDDPNPLTLASIPRQKSGHHIPRRHLKKPGD